MSKSSKSESFHFFLFSSTKLICTFPAISGLEEKRIYKRRAEESSQSKENEKKKKKKKKKNKKKKKKRKKEKERKKKTHKKFFLTDNNINTIFHHQENYLLMNLKLMLVDNQDFLLASGARVCKSCDCKKTSSIPVERSRPLSPPLFA